MQLPNYKDCSPYERRMIEHALTFTEKDEDIEGFTSNGSIVFIITANKPNLQRSREWKNR